MTSLDDPADGVIQLGMIYEDCAFHPVLCLEVDEDRSVAGISLIDGSYPRSCSLDHCGVVVLDLADVMAIRSDFAGYVARRQEELSRSRHRRRSGRRGRDGRRGLAGTERDAAGLVAEPGEHRDQEQ
ncbi:hypothetical protein ACTWPT_53680, partial [Nonomuraea sp. 3N208]|uniref:hypothetical protein n=1 Tax=Nonomuraea sp. 3N208 TaxID=3457421 RepID=UPI003FD399C0